MDCTLLVVSIFTPTPPLIGQNPCFFLFFCYFPARNEVKLLNSINFSQLTFLLRNRTNAKLDKHIDRHNFFLLFITHVQEHLQSLQKDFSILQPIFDPSFKEDSSTTLAINSVEVGDLRLLFNSNYGESSLVYFSPSGLIHSTLFEYDTYSDVTLSDYALLIYEFSAMLIGHELLYTNEKRA